jgi:hypothetical protein
MIIEDFTLVVIGIWAVEGSAIESDCQSCEVVACSIVRDLIFDAVQEGFIGRISFMKVTCP